MTPKAKRRRRATRLDLALARGNREIAAKRYLNAFRKQFPTLRHDSMFAAVWREIERLLLTKN